MTKTQTIVNVASKFWEDAGDDIIGAGVVKAKYYEAEPMTRDYPGCDAFTEHWIDDDVTLMWRPPSDMKVSELDAAIESILQDCTATHPKSEAKLRFKNTLNGCKHDKAGIYFEFAVDEVEEVG